jgi:aromatic-L-amino-acid/L-tryptophan decarboxylase
MTDSELPAPPHMTPDEFRRLGRELVDWVADYMERVEELPVRSRSQPGDTRAMLPAAPPEHGEPWDDILADLDRVVLPGITHWQSPNFYAYFPASSSGASVLGELVAAGLGVQGMLWSTSPACTELETHMLDWMAGMLDLPAAFRSDGAGGGVIQDSASSAVLCALVAAREAATGSGPLVAYTSDQGHSSIEKAARITGVELRLISVGEDSAMRPEALEEAILEDLAAGRRPVFCAATVGTTSTTAIDPVAAIGEICRRHGLWLHVDAAFAGVAAVCPELRFVNDGLELASSVSTNPHKWLLVNFDCGLFWVRDRAALIQALSVLPEYLRNAATESGAVIDYRDWQVPLGRRFRALKLWFVIRHYGVEGLRAHIRRSIALAQRFAARVSADPRFELAAPAPLSLVCFRLREGGDEANQRLLDAVNESGRAFLTHARLGDRLTLRLAVGHPSTEARHVDETADLLLALATDVAKEPLQR